MSEYPSVAIGSRFGKLLVVGDGGIVKRKQMWRVLCDCKNETIVPGIRLKVGKTTSCGCRRKSGTKLTPIPSSKISNTTLIPLSAGQYAIIDQEDYEKVSQKAWYYKKSRSTGYAVWRGKINGVKSTVLMHRFVLDAADTREIDHKNMNGLDNRKCNLRLARSYENRRNCAKRKHNTSGFKGVVRDKKHSKWRAQLKNGPKNLYLGLFTTAIDAAKAYDKAAQEYFGEFARCNFPA